MDVDRDDVLLKVLSCKFDQSSLTSTFWCKGEGAYDGNVFLCPCYDSVWPGREVVLGDAERWVLLRVGNGVRHEEHDEVEYGMRTGMPIAALLSTGRLRGGREIQHDEEERRG